MPTRSTRPVRKYIACSDGLTKTFLWNPSVRIFKNEGLVDEQNKFVCSNVFERARTCTCKVLEAPLGSDGVMMIYSKAQKKDPLNLSLW